MAQNKRDREVEEVLGPRRQYGRVQVNHEFQSLDEFITEYVRDISYGGVFIRTESPLPTGTLVDLRFTIIADELETLEGTGLVVRSVYPGGGAVAGMGVAFDELTEASRAVVERLTGNASAPRR
jgi:uncharacterized protein (TIGR02266 family)